MFYWWIHNWYCFQFHHPNIPDLETSPPKVPNHHHILPDYPPCLCGGPRTFLEVGWKIIQLAGFCQPPWRESVDFPAANVTSPKPIGFVCLHRAHSSHIYLYRYRSMRLYMYVMYVCMYNYVYITIHIYNIYIYICVNKHTHTHTYIYICITLYNCIYIYIHVCVTIYAFLLCDYLVCQIVYWIS